MPVTPVRADENTGSSSSKLEDQAEAKSGGWFRKLFKWKGKKGEETVPDSSEGAAVSGEQEQKQSAGGDRRADTSKKGFKAIGQKLAEILVLEDEADTGKISREAPGNDGSRITIPDAKRIDMFVVTEDGTPLYENGPLQSKPVDLKLNSGAIVSMVKWRKGWSDVRLGSGEFGTVATDLLRKAKASDFPVEELVVKSPASGDDERYVDAILPEMLPLLDSPELPDFSVPNGVDGSDRELGLNPLLLPPLPE